MDNTSIQDAVKQEVERQLKRYRQDWGFTDRKLTDTPTDALAVVNRKFVTLNGTTGARPPSPVTGQFYFDSTINKPLWYNGTTFVDATGTPS